MQGGGALIPTRHYKTVILLWEQILVARKRHGGIQWLVSTGNAIRHWQFRLLVGPHPAKRRSIGCGWHQQSFRDARWYRCKRQAAVPGSLPVTRDPECFSV